MLDRIDVHCTWVSQPVLDLLPSDLPEAVPGGEIIRDPGLGVFCDNAMDMVISIWPQPGRDFKARAVKTAMKRLNEVGLVGMHDAGATPGTLNLYNELSSGDDWTLRVYAMLECPQRNSYCPEVAVKFARDDDRFAVQSVKLFAGMCLFQNHLRWWLTSDRRRSRKLGQRHARPILRSPVDIRLAPYQRLCSY